jgi:small subunit ribosomal protein S17
MADDEKKIEETADEPVVEETPAAEEAPVVEETAAEPTPPASEEVSDTEAPATSEAPADEVSATTTADEAPAASAKPSRSQRHVPRSERRTRSKVVREKPKTRKPITRTEKPDYERGRRQERRGVVVSDKADKTIIVKVDVIKSHPKYKKVIRSTVKFHAHDEANTAGVGDTVRIVETRPLSKLKHWRLAEIVEKAK